MIFDIDNVLVDTRRSYLDAIRWTVEIFLTSGSVPLFHLTRMSRQPQLLSACDVQAFKLLGGFNDDWDCCYGLLIYLLSLQVAGHTVESLKKAIDLKAFGETVFRRPLGVSGIVNKLGRNREVTIETISRIFQEVYLGKDIFSNF